MNKKLIKGWFDAVRDANVDAVRRLGSWHGPALLNLASPVFGRTAIHLAAERGDCSTLWELLRLGCDADMLCCDTFAAPLHAAANHGQADCALILLEHGANREQPDGAMGWTPLMCAVTSPASNVRTLRVLLQAGCDPRFRDETGHTLLHEAAQTNDGERLSILLDVLTPADMEDSDRQGRTPLSAAISCGADQAALLLLARRANAVTFDNDGASPLHLAASIGNARLVAALLDRGVDANLLSRCGRSRTPLHYAAALAHGDSVIRHLAARGADVGAVDDMGMTPLLIACMRPDDEFFDYDVRALLAHGADPNGAPTSSTTPLREANRRGIAPVLKVLRAAGASPQRQLAKTPVSNVVALRRVSRKRLG